MPVPMTRERFLQRVDKSGDCWLWTGYRDKHGYGEVGYQNRLHRAHRLSLHFHEGFDLNPEAHVLHSCNTPACVNPAHLRVGTHRDNMHDKFTDGTQPLGRGHHNSKLTPELVRQIRSLRGSKTYRRLAEIFGVTNGTISAVMAGRTWNHIRS